MRRISDCAMVRSATDGHDAHSTYCDIAHSNCSKDDSNFADSNFADSDNSSEDNCDFAHSNIASFGGCFCVPRRLV